MVPYHRSQSRIIKSSGSRFGIRLADVSAVVRYILSCLARAVFKLWHLNPVSLVLQRWRQLHHLNTRMTLRVRPRLIDLATDFFLSDDRRKRQLLCWVKAILPWLEEELFDFTACWQDGIVLCALMESISPGACPKFNLLKAHHRVNNCRLGIQLAMRYLHVNELPLSPEEMAIAEDDSEVKICHLVQLLKWKYQKQGSKPAVFSAVSLEPAVECKCQARGTGLKAGIVGKRAKFNILTERVTNLDLLIEIRGPNKEYNKERIVSVNTGVKSRFRDQVKAAVSAASEDDGKRKIIDDGAGHSFLRHKSLDEDQGHQVIPFDCQCVGEGRFLATYIPRNAGLHTITVVSGGAHIAGSPFEVKVSDWVSSWNLFPKSPMVPFDMLKPVDEAPQDPEKPAERVIRKLSHVAHVSKQLTRMKRRILRKVITASGEAIICDVTPTLSRQNSGNFDLSGDDGHRKGADVSSSAQSQSKATKKNGKISENYPVANHSIQSNTSAGTIESLTTSHTGTSSSPKYHRPARDAGDAFLATVVAARTAMVASAAEDTRNNGTDLTKASVNTGDDLLASVKEDLQHSPLKSGPSTVVRSNSESTPQIVITSNFEAHHGDLGNDKHVLIAQNTNNTVNEDVSNNITDHSTEVNTGMLSNFYNKSESDQEVAAISECKNDHKDSNEIGSDSSNRNDSSKTGSPFLRVSDVVGTLLGNLKQDKRDQPVSPAHMHYIRSFSVDETHQHHAATFNQDWSFFIGGSKSPSVSTINKHSNVQESIHSHSRQQMLPSLRESAISFDDNSGKISPECLPTSPLLESPFCENNPSTGKLEDDMEFSASQDAETESSRINACLNCLQEINKQTNTTDAEDHLSYCETYCARCTNCIQEPAIKKEDLDQRVYEIIEEMSERDNDSSRHDGDISEASVDGVANDEIKFSEAMLNLPEEIRLSTAYKSLADLSKDIAATRLAPYQTSLSFDIADIRPKHTIIWSQSKSFSEERKLRKSRSYPFRADNLLDKEWTDITAMLHSSLTSDGQCNVTEDELFSSDSDEGNHHTLEEKNSNDRQNGLISSANKLFDINVLFNNNGNNDKREHLSKKNWSQRRVMSLIDTNDFHGKISPNDETNSGTKEKRDNLLKTKKWNTFQAISSVNGLSVPDDLDHLIHVQHGILGEELDTEDDEILQIIIDDSVIPSSVNDKLGNNKPMLASTSLASGTFDGCGYPSHCDDPFSVSQKENTFDVNSNEITQCADMSPLSDVSNKSGNSDWSDNENSPTRITTYRKSARRRSSSKGDWSPQLVDLTYYGSLVSETEPRIQKETEPSRDGPSRDSNSASFPIEAGAPNSNINNEAPVSSQRNESVLISSSYFCDRKTQGTQYELPFVSVSETKNFNAQLAPEYSTQAFKQITSMLPGKQTFSYCSQDLAPCQTASNFSHDTVSDELSVYIKRRRKPLYTSDNSPENNQSVPIKVLPNLHKVNTKHPVHNIPTDAEFPDREDINSFFATLRLLSPDVANYLSLDNWASSNSDSSDDCVYDNTLCRGEARDYLICSSPETAQSHMNYFRERTLTPTKYRTRKQNARRKVKFRQRFSGRANISSLQNKNRAYPLIPPEQTENKEDTGKDEVTLQLVTQPGSARVATGLGDRTLTPTKYRRDAYLRFKDNGHHLRTINTKERKLKQQSQLDDIYPDDTEGSSSDDTSRSTKQPKASAHSLGNYFHNPNRINSNTFVSNKHGAYRFGGNNSFTPIDSEVNEVGTNLPYGRNLENNMASSCCQYRSNNIQTQMASFNHSTDNYNTVLSQPRISAPYSSPSSRDGAIDENGYKLYVRKRRKIMLQESGSNISSSCHNKDNNESINLLNDEKLYGEDTANMSSVYTASFPQRRSFQLNRHENPMQSLQHHQNTAADSHHYKHNTYHPAQAFHHTRPPDFSPTRSPHYPQHYLECPTDYNQPQNSLLEDQMYLARRGHNGSVLPASLNHSHQRSIYQPHGQAMHQQLSETCPDQGINVQQLPQSHTLYLQSRRDHDHSQDHQDISDQVNSLIREQQHREHKHQDHKHQEHQQNEDRQQRHRATQERHSRQPHQERQVDEGRGNRGVVFMRQSTLDTPDSGITDDIMHYSVPLTYIDSTEDRF